MGCFTTLCLGVPIFQTGIMIAPTLKSECARNNVCQSPVTQELNTQFTRPCRNSSGRLRETPPFPRWNNRGTRGDWALGSVSERSGSSKLQCRWASSPKGMGQRTPLDWWQPQFSFPCASFFFFLIASAIIGIIFIKEKWKPKDFLSKCTDLSHCS